MAIKKYRKFGGKRYLLSVWSSQAKTKDAAKQIAEHIRRDGKWARVVKIGTRHRVFWRKKIDGKGILAEVFRCIKSRGEAGATDQQIQRELGVRRKTIGARRRELVQMGLVRPRGDLRLNVSGYMARVWVTDVKAAGQYIAATKALEGRRNAPKNNPR